MKCLAIVSMLFLVGCGSENPDPVDDGNGLKVCDWLSGTYDAKWEPDPEPACGDEVPNAEVKYRANADVTGCQIVATDVVVFCTGNFWFSDCYSSGRLRAMLMWNEDASVVEGIVSATSSIDGGCVPKWRVTLTRKTP